MTNSDKIITNRGIFKAGEFQEASTISGHSVYEVIRIAEGVPLFLEDHFARLLKSFEILGLSFGMDYSFFSMKIDQLVTLNQKREGNVRFVYVAEENNGTWSISFIPHSYPSADDYFKGVKVGLLLAERDNPNAKVVQQSVRDRANQMIAEQSLYEVLLVDREGQITEGSRSNVFFVKDEVFYTAPASVVLVGITRQKVLECLQELNFRIVEDAVLASGIDQFDAAFLTGTSPKVLPVCSVDRQLFNPDFQCVRQLIKAYDEMIDRYLEQKRLNIHSF